jgi:hypothetical protein
LAEQLRTVQEEEEEAKRIEEERVREEEDRRIREAEEKEQARLLEEETNRVLGRITYFQEIYDNLSKLNSRLEVENVEEISKVLS